MARETGNQQGMPIGLAHPHRVPPALTVSLETHGMLTLIHLPWKDGEKCRFDVWLLACLFSRM